MSKLDGGPAFPSMDFTEGANDTSRNAFHAGPTGMTLRVWLAGQVLAGMADGRCVGNEPPPMYWREKVVETAYQLADLMLLEGAKDD